jgi:threonylcarbamoyladenosine tRNA methylthiotransferase MtaB
LLPHFHLSAQHGHDLILKRMKRRHTRADMITACARVRAVRPDAVFGADIICGFPTEDDTHFKSSVDLVADCGLTHLHVFSYSPRPGTPAARMPQVNGAVAKERTQTLRAVGQQALRAFMQSRVGKTEQILVEKDNTGHTAQYIPCKISSPTPITAGSLCAALITDVADEHLIGEIL